MLKVTKAFDWHIEGEIVEVDVAPLEVDEHYVEKMRADLEGEKIGLEDRKRAKLAVLKEKKKEIMSKLYEDKPANSNVSAPIAKPQGEEQIQMVSSLRKSPEKVITSAPRVEQQP